MCELPQDAVGAPPASPRADEAPSGLLRLWRSGQGPVGAAVLCHLLALVLPFVTVASGGSSRTVSPLALMLGNDPLLRGKMIWLVPATAAFLTQMLASRRTRPVMEASRPLVLVVSLAPLVGVALPYLLFQKRHLEPALGPSALMVLVGVALGVLGALRFGVGAPEEKPRRRRDDED